MEFLIPVIWIMIAILRIVFRERETVIEQLFDAILQTIETAFDFMRDICSRELGSHDSFLSSYFNRRRETISPET